MLKLIMSDALINEEKFDLPSFNGWIPIIDYHSRNKLTKESAVGFIKLSSIVLHHSDIVNRIAHRYSNGTDIYCSSEVIGFIDPNHHVIVNSNISPKNFDYLFLTENQNGYEFLLINESCAQDRYENYLDSCGKYFDTLKIPDDNILELPINPNDNKLLSELWMEGNRSRFVYTHVNKHPVAIVLNYNSVNHFIVSLNRHSVELEKIFTKQSWLSIYNIPGTEDYMLVVEPNWVKK